MQYDVIISADGVPADQLSAAAGKFRVALESKLSGSRNVVGYFLAHAKEARSGRASLFTQEVVEADAYSAAFADAEAAMRLFLNRQDANAMVRLSAPGQ